MYKYWDTMLRLRHDIAYWMLGDPESLRFWKADTETYDDSTSTPNMKGKMLLTKIQALKHMAHLKEDKPNDTVKDIALETVATVEVYWRMARTPTQVMTKGPKLKIKAAERLIMKDEARSEAVKKMDCDFLDVQYKGIKMVMGGEDTIYLEAYLELEQAKLN